jgi:hypothetical protein
MKTYVGVDVLIHVFLTSALVKNMSILKTPKKKTENAVHFTHKKLRRGHDEGISKLKGRTPLHQGRNGCLKTGL